MNTKKFYEDLSLAYYEARQGERNKKSSLTFERRLEANLVALASELTRLTWKPTPPYYFIIKKPTVREIFAPNFRDRIVSHYLFNKVYSIIDRHLIHDSYSCRYEKGVLFGIDRVRKMTETISSSWKKSAWCLNLDISGYFMSIHRPTLMKLVFKILDKHSAELNDLDFIKYLITQLLDRDPIKGARFLGNPGDKLLLPPSKSLRNSPADTGLPIGDLMSQLFSNLYLNELDQYIKRELKVKYYGRYVDDAVLLSDSKENLQNLIPKINKFLRDELHLKLNKKKTKICEIHQGVDFLGATIKENRIIPKQRFIKAIKNCTDENVNSIMGLAGWYNCVRVIGTTLYNKFRDGNKYEISLSFKAR